MNVQQIRAIRLYNQLLTSHTLKEPHEVVSWMGAVQAQQYPMAKWAIGTRLPGVTNAAVEKAINEDKIIRTHILRPTWHLVSSEDIHWMLDLTALRIKQIVLNYCKHSGEDEDFLNKGVRLVEKILTKEKHLTRQEIAERLQGEGVEVDIYRINHIMMWAELEGVACNGIAKGSKQTYHLLQEKAPRTVSLTTEEALERLARKYFGSHGPATLQDFVWWSGLRATDARKGLESIRHDFMGEAVGSETYWFRNDLQLPPAGDAPSVLLLPAFDEYIVAYRDRSDILKEEHNRTVITRTGIFSPAIVIDGEVVGTWKNATSKAQIIDLSFFGKEKKQLRSLFTPLIENYKAFWGK